MKKTFKQVVILTCLIAGASTGLHAQLNEYFKARELQATPQIRTKLANARTLIQQRKFKFEVANTSVTGRSKDSITGYKMLSKAEYKMLRDNRKARIKVRYPFKLAPSFANGSKLDLRNFHLVTPVRAQACGNCWTYASMGSYESNYLLTHYNETYSDSDPNSPANLDLAEQQMLSCSQAGDCIGGWMSGVFNWLESSKTYISRETQNPDQGWGGPACAGINAAANNNYQVADWDFISDSEDNWAVPTVQQIKNAIATHGAVTAAFIAGAAASIISLRTMPAAFMMYHTTMHFAIQSPVFFMPSPSSVGTTPNKPGSSKIHGDRAGVSMVTAGWVTTAA